MDDRYIRGVRKAGALAALCFALLFAVAAPVQAQDEEHDLIAVFIVNFLNFVVWPNADTNSEMHVCVDGNDKVAEVVQYIIDKKKLSAKAFKVNGDDALDACHILFVGKNKRGDVDTILAKTQKKPILIASDASGFASDGGVVEFVKSQNKFKLRVNVQAYKARNLKFDPRMLQLTELVNP